MLLLIKVLVHQSGEPPMSDVLTSVSRYAGRVRRRWTKLLRDESGVSAVEYGLLLAGVGLLIMIAVFEMGDALEGLFNHIRTTFTTSYNS